MARGAGAADGGARVLPAARTLYHPDSTCSNETVEAASTKFTARSGAKEKEEEDTEHGSFILSFPPQQKEDQPSKVSAIFFVSVEPAS